MGFAGLPPRTLLETFFEKKVPNLQKTYKRDIGFMVRTKIDPEILCGKEMNLFSSLFEVFC